MAIILKKGKKYRPVNPYGKDFTGCVFYGVIDSITYDKKERICFFDLRFFSSQAARNNGSDSIENIPFHFIDDSFSKNIGNNGLTISEAYQKVLEVMFDWESDEIV